MPGVTVARAHTIWVVAVVLWCSPGSALAQTGAASHASAKASALAQAQGALQAGRYDEAEQAFVELTSGGRLEGAARGRALLGLGRLQLQTGRYAAAGRTAAAARKMGIDAFRAHTLQGEALAARGQLDAAERAFARAIRVRARKSKEALRARVLLGRLLRSRGRMRQAEPHLMAVIEAYNSDALPSSPKRAKAAGLAYTAMAARALGSYHDANDAFREAALAERSRVETQLEWASLFLEKNDKQNAMASVEEALEHNPHHPVAQSLMARLVFARAYDFPGAKEHLDEALAVNPRLPMVFVSYAAMALRNMDIEEADRQLDRALDINPHHLEALSVRAAARFLADDEAGFARAKREVLKRNPHFSRMYSIIGEYAEWEHRYDRLIEMAREALAIDSEDPRAYAMLGINLLRAGEEKEGLEALNEAWERDRFNVHVFNTLNLYDEVISKEYTSFDAPPFRIRMHKEERSSLAPYLVPLLTGAYEDMRTRYGYTPRGPLHLELYADRQHFSVRTTGLPNVGVQGVCFGRVITALSPRGGPFNWGQITWHELAHVFHLQLSKNHVPRWFTEGLAEYETVIAREEWRREEDHNVWEALQRDAIPSLSEFNRAFTSARNPEDLMTGYYVAYRAVAYLIERFGFEKVPAMLTAWGQGKRTADVMRDVLGIELAQLDRDFRAYLKERLAKYDTHFFVDFSRFDDLAQLEANADKAPKDADALAALAAGYILRDRFEDAGRVGVRAIRLAPHHPLAHFVVTRVALERGQVERAQRCLKAILEGGHDGYILRILFARAKLAGDQPREALAQAEAAIALDPKQLEAYRVMLDVAEKTSDDTLARRALTALAKLDQHDRAVHFALMSVLKKDESWSELVRVGENTIYLDPENPHVHRLLGEAYVETKAPKKALRELDRALALGQVRAAPIHLLRARAFRALGQTKRSRAAAKRAAELDSSLSDEAKELFAP